MKKLILSAALLVSVATFAQKEELKTLKKIYAKETISEKDLETYKATSDVLQSLASDESDKVYAKFYKTMYPTLVFLEEISLLAKKVLDILMLQELHFPLKKELCLPQEESMMLPDQTRIFLTVAVEWAGAAIPI